MTLEVLAHTAEAVILRKQETLSVTTRMRSKSGTAYRRTQVGQRAWGPRPDGWAVHRAGCCVRRCAPGLPEGFVCQALDAHGSPPPRLGRRYWQWPGISVAEHYDSVVATDVPAEQLRHATPHPKVRYLHTPDATPGEDLVTMLGGEASVDLITVAQAVHWFDLPAFYGVARRVLRRPGGVIAVWGMMAHFFDTTLPYWDTRARFCTGGYRDLPFPFEDIGLGKE